MSLLSLLPSMTAIILAMVTSHLQLLAAEVARGKELVDKLREERAPEVAEVRVTVCDEKGAGKIAAGRSPHQKGGFAYYFSEKDCKTCAFKESCAGEKATGRRIYVNPGILKYRARGIKVAMRLRKTVERVFGDAKVWHGMARARYRGLTRVMVQALMTFIVTNVKKMVQNLSPSSSMA
ncbi:MAG: transposase [Bacillota bacterium]